MAEPNVNILWHNLGSRKPEIKVLSGHAHSEICEDSFIVSCSFWGFASNRFLGLQLLTIVYAFSAQDILPVLLLFTWPSSCETLVLDEGSSLFHYDVILPTTSAMTLFKNKITFSQVVGVRTSTYLFERNSV